jgi:hypothetical protein
MIIFLSLFFQQRKDSDQKESQRRAEDGDTNSNQYGLVEWACEISRAHRHANARHSQRDKGDNRSSN